MKAEGGDGKFAADTANGVIRRRKQQPPPPSCAYGRPPPSALLCPVGSWFSLDSPSSSPLQPPGVVTSPCSTCATRGDAVPPLIPVPWDVPWMGHGHVSGLAMDAWQIRVEYRHPTVPQMQPKELSGSPSILSCGVRPWPHPSPYGGCEHRELPGPRGGSQLASMQWSSLGVTTPFLQPTSPSRSRAGCWAPQSHQRGYPCMPAPCWSQEPTCSPAGQCGAWEPAAPGACQAPGRAAGAGTPLPWGKLSWFSSSRGSRQSVQGWDGAAATAAEGGGRSVVTPGSAAPRGGGDGRQWGEPLLAINTWPQVGTGP